MVGEPRREECAMPVADPLVLQENRFHVRVFIEPGAERQALRVLLHREQARGDRVLGKRQRVLPVQAEPVGFDEVVRLVLRDTVQHVGNDQLARAPLRELLVELQCRHGVPEILVDRGQEKVEVFDRALRAPVPQADFAAADVARGVDVQREIIVAAVDVGSDPGRVACRILPVQRDAELVPVTAQAAGDEGGA